MCYMSPCVSAYFFIWFVQHKVCSKSRPRDLSCEVQLVELRGPHQWQNVETWLDFALIYCIPAKEWIREYNPNSFCRLICTRKTKMYLKTILRTFSCVRTLGIFPSTSIPSRLLLNVPESSAHDSVAFKPLRNMFLLFTNVCRCMISSVLYIPGPQVFQHLLPLLMLLVIPNRQISEKQRSLGSH